MGTAWSLGGGAVGAIGALGVIMAFNLGGKPVYVMPLVFGGAPVREHVCRGHTARCVGKDRALFLRRLDHDRRWRGDSASLRPAISCSRASAVPPTTPPLPPKIEPKPQSVKPRP